jgi:hypothetical protein
MVIHDVDSNSLWVEALKDNTSSKLILAHAQALEQMQKVGIVLEHQVLDNQASVVYKKAIGNLDMTYELVLPVTPYRPMLQMPVITHRPLLQMRVIINRTQPHKLQMPAIPHGIL